jgi:CubicO group peptidase (beta-lactamase class C family)
MKTLLLIALFSVPLLALAQAPSASGDRVDEFIRAAREQMYVPGLAVAVVKDGELVKSAAYGMANVEYGVPATPKTLFLVASITKVFTATSVMMLVEQEKIRLDEPIKTYLTDAPDAWNAITVRMLLGHTAGLADRWEETDPTRWRLAYSTADLYAAAKTTPLDSPPGKAWKYSDQGYFLLGLILERVSGRTYGQFLRERIFDPAGMPTSTLTSQTELIENLAQGYGAAQQKWVKNHRRTDYGLVSHFGVLTTAEELAAFDRALMSGKLLEPETLRAMWEPSTSAFGAYGLGWFLDEFNGHRIVHHGGSTGAEYLKYPDDGLTVIVLTNLEMLSGGNAGALATAVARTYVKGLSWADVAAKTDPDPRLAEIILSELANLAAGTMDESVYTAAFARVLRPMLPAQRAGLAPFGPVKRCEFLGGSTSGASRIARYRVVFEAMPLYATVQLDGEGKIASFTMEGDASAAGP